MYNVYVCVVREGEGLILVLSEFRVYLSLCGSLCGCVLEVTVVALIRIMSFPGRLQLTFSSYSRQFGVITIRDVPLFSRWPL